MGKTILKLAFRLSFPVILTLAALFFSSSCVFAQQQNADWIPRFNTVLGTQAIGGRYQFTKEAPLGEATRTILGMGSSRKALPRSSCRQSPSRLCWDCPSLTISAGPTRSLPLPIASSRLPSPMNTKKSSRCILRISDFTGRHRSILRAFIKTMAAPQRRRSLAEVLPPG